MAVPPRRLAPKRLGEARRRYEETREPVDDIARFLGIASRTFFTLARKLGWQSRKTRPVAPRPALPPVQDRPAIPAPLSPNATAVAERIQRTVERELAAIEQIVAMFEPASTHTGEAERAARVLASLTRTLHEVMRLSETSDPKTATGSGEHADDDRGPADPDDFIRDLARRMDAFASRDAGAVPDDVAPGGA